MWENISWLDIVSFLFSVATFGIALRMDLRQARQLRDVEQKEDRLLRRRKK